MEKTNFQTDQVEQSSDEQQKKEDYGENSLIMGRYEKGQREKRTDLLG